MEVQTTTPKQQASVNSQCKLLAAAELLCCKVSFAVAFLLEITIVIDNLSVVYCVKGMEAQLLSHYCLVKDNLLTVKSIKNVLNFPLH